MKLVDRKLRLSLHFFLALYNGSDNLPSGSNSLGRLSKDAILHHQRAEKLSEELLDQQNRRHGYM